VSAHDEKTAQLLAELYKKIVGAGVYKTRDIKTAEAAKIIENIQRDLNIALVNELAIIFGKMGIDANEVLDAAGTKWNFHPYRPGLVGGHCIPIDPYYLVYKAKSLKYNPRIILSGRDINEYMPVHVAKMVLNNLKKYGKKPKRSNVLLLGLAFKKNVGDIRNSPSKVLIDELKREKVKVIGWEPMMPDDILIEAFGIDIVKDIDFSKKIDCIVLVTDHDAFKDIKIDKLLKMSRGKPIMIDVRGFFDRDKMEKAGFEYVRL
jgi:nucleotide sugar dehydrogenase